MEKRDAVKEWIKGLEQGSYNLIPEGWVYFNEEELRDFHLYLVQELRYTQMQYEQAKAMGIIH